MGRGGARVGAGRKPKTPLEFPVIDGGKSDAGLIHAEPPDDVPESHKKAWRLNAPLAIQRGTLTPQTGPQFRALCRIEAELSATDATIEADGRTFVKVTVDGAGQEHQELKAHPLLSHYRALLKQQQSLLKDFMLGPFGKPIAVAPSRSKLETQKATARARFFGVKSG
jgi:hypothetical protein